MVDASPKDETQVTQFAVTNVAELLERSAYYGFVSIFSLYLDSLGYAGAAIGAIGVLLLALPYVIPILTSPLAEKLGYKPVMLVALVFYTAGFGVLATSDGIGRILVGVILVALGAGGFKPIATASVAHVTAERHRSLGYTIYYTGINVGGFLGPLVVALLTDSYAAGFLTAAGIMAAALVLVLVAYRSPRPPQRELSVAASMAKLGSIVHDRRLVVLLLVFSGFWFLYSMNFSFLALYLDRFVDLPSWFKPSLQQSFNPFIVIFLGIPIGAIATRNDPRRMMTLGVLLYVVGFTVLAFVQHVAAFFVGLAIATLGEILAYPAFLTYIAGIAPKDRVSVYQSYGFLPLFIGFFFGPLACGPIYEAVAVEAGRPELFWAVPITVGILALVGFLATAAMQGERTARRGGLARAAVVLLLVPLLFGAAALAGPQDARPEEGATAGLATVDLPAIAASTTEGQSTTRPFDVPADARGNLTFTLTWSDEAPGTPGATNAADTFRLEVRGRGATGVSLLLGEAEGANPGNGEGELVVVVPVDALLPRSLELVVTLVEAGEQQATVPLAGPVELAQDTGNAWSLTPAKQVAQPATS